jgi:CheY-like chemotaxis protein
VSIFLPVENIVFLFDKEAFSSLSWKLLDSFLVAQKRMFEKGATMRRVLVVDDDRLVADTLTLIFERNGFAAKAVYSADEALQCSREFAPHLLLCDVTMPARDGLSLVEDITRELPSCRILVLTGFYSNLKSVREQARKLSRPLGVLTKPCQPAELLREAAALLATV